MTSVLVAYASKHGSTAEIAAALADTLRASGLNVDCSEVSDAGALEAYDAVILGSAVYMKRWRREARRFLHRHAAELARRPLWVFSTGPVGDPAKDDPAWSEPAATIAEAERLGLRGHAVFGGALRPEPEGMMQRSMASNIPEPFRDRRDWDEIRAWATGVAAELASHAPAAR